MDLHLLYKIAVNLSSGNPDKQIEKAIADAKLEGNTDWLQHEEIKAFLKTAIGYFNPIRREIRDETIVTHWIRVANAVWNSPFKNKISAEHLRLGTFVALAHDAQEEAAILDSKIGLPIISQFFQPKGSANLYHKTRLKKGQIEPKQFILFALGKLFDWEIKDDFERIQAQIVTIGELDLDNQSDLLLALIKYTDKKDNLDDSLADLHAGRMNFTNIDKVQERIIKLQLNREVIFAMPEPRGLAEKVRELKEQFYAASSEIQHVLTETYGERLIAAKGANWANPKGYKFNDTYRRPGPNRPDLGDVIARQKNAPFVPKSP